MKSGGAEDYLEEGAPSVGAFKERRADHQVIGLETSVFIYQAPEKYLPLTRELLQGIEAGR